MKQCVYRSNNIPEGLENIAESTELVFLWWEGDENGVFVTRIHYEFMEIFYKAKECSESWVSFWSALGKWGQKYVTPFMSCDEITPENGDLLKDVSHGIFILDDVEFPITQCAEETYSFIVIGLPDDYLVDTIRTEYGSYIGLYPKSRFVEMKDIFERKGYTVNSIRSPFPKNIFHYAG